MSREATDILEEYVQGDDWPIEVNIVDSNGDAVDISGFTSAHFTMKEEIDAADDDSAAIITSDVTSGFDATGVITFNIPDTATKDVDPDIKYYYDVQLVDGAGVVYTPAFGRFKAIPEVTRRIA